jgi:hypothetical protein
MNSTLHAKEIVGIQIRNSVYFQHVENIDRSCGSHPNVGLGEKTRGVG